MDECRRLCYNLQCNEETLCADVQSLIRVISLCYRYQNYINSSLVDLYTLSTYIYLFSREKNIAGVI